MESIWVQVNQKLAIKLNTVPETAAVNSGNASSSVNCKTKANISQNKTTL